MVRSLSDFALPRDPDGAMEAATKQYVDAGDAGAGQDVIFHGSDATVARPDTAASSVLWIGSVEPNNATVDDLWYDTDATADQLIGHDHPATGITVDPTGMVVVTGADAQAAIAELDGRTDVVHDSDHTKVLHDGLGIDADTVDGSHASAFATSGHDHHAAYVQKALVSSGYREVADINWADTTGAWTDTLSIPCVAGVTYHLDVSCQGWFENNASSNSSARGRVEYSVDGGSTWHVSRDVIAYLGALSATAYRMPMLCRHVAQRTPTVNEVLVRGRGWNEGGTNSVDFRFPTLAGTLIPA